MSQLALSIAAGTILFLVTSFVSLAVFAVRSMVKASALEQDNARLALELKIASQQSNLVDEFRALVHSLEEQLHLRDEVREGFAMVSSRLPDRRTVERRQP